ncbi:uncharacterized protein EI90DRAFT_2299758 [Cantharellus anzutake]|uniref:uncharacterized protein n=1 Tax=Cantharellus anzutake TaxID=1750568 RepID=UPI001907A080|nr:uncharacterized protein EI90DRAFT_2299758 [Cantharellus anzutake]KAF8339892.1 hypothetical protein EI90DRAFT_2299758 [Cantharellus anzutake]
MMSAMSGGVFTAIASSHLSGAQPIIGRNTCIRSPPPGFTAEPLPPSKISTTWYYGVRVGAAFDEHETRRSTMTSQQYEIWRRWEDLLELQHLLGIEYESLALLKIQLISKESKSSSPSTRAASFDSLPSYSDPPIVQTDLHHHVPKLSKKSNIFRNNSNLVGVRAKQFSSFLTAVFGSKDELIVIARSCQQVCEWFGWWKQDDDAWSKLAFSHRRKRDGHLPRNPTISNPEDSHERGAIKPRAGSLNEIAVNPKLPRPNSEKINSDATIPSPKTSTWKEITFIPAAAFPMSRSAGAPTPSGSKPVRSLSQPLPHRPTLRTTSSLPSMSVEGLHSSPLPSVSSSNSLPASPHSSIPLCTYSHNDMSVPFRTAPIPRKLPPPTSEPPPLPPEASFYRPQPKARSTVPTGATSVSESRPQLASDEIEGSMSLADMARKECQRWTRCQG